MWHFVTASVTLQFTWTGYRNFCFSWLIHSSDSMVVNSRRDRENNSFPSSTFRSAFTLPQCVWVRLLFRASGWLKPLSCFFFFFNFFDSSLLRCEVPLLNLSTVEHKQMRKCSDIGTCWWELEESRPNEMRLRGDAVHTKSSKPHHIIFTWQQQSKGWDGERSKGWAWENKSGAKFGVTVTAEGKKGNLEGGETKLAFFSFCLQTARRGRTRGTVAFCSKTSFAWKCVRS